MTTLADQKNFRQKLKAYHPLSQEEGVLTQFIWSTGSH